jgi:hypothetical protein
VPRALLTSVPLHPGSFGVDLRSFGYATHCVRDCLRFGVHSLMDGRALSGAGRETSNCHAGVRAALHHSRTRTFYNLVS